MILIISFRLAEHIRDRIPSCATESLPPALTDLPSHATCPNFAGPGSPSQCDPIYKFAEGEPCRERAPDDKGRQAYAQHVGSPWPVSRKTR